MNDSNREAPAVRARERAEMTRARRILVVDDEPNVRLVFLAALASNDYAVSAAEDGETALRWLKAAPTDLVLLDLQMPGMSGMETLRKAREAGIGVPVVIVSAHDSVPNVVQAVRLGAADFLSKPTTPAALRRVVAEVLARGEAVSAGPTASGPRMAAGPGPAVGHLARAKAALNLRDFDEAFLALEAAAASDPRCAEARYLLGVLQEMRGRRDDAYNAYRAALLADPEHEPSHLHLMKFFDDRLM